MAMAAVIVTCGNAQRDVFVDNQFQGITDTVIAVPEGTHLFDLGAPVNYTPEFHELTIEDRPEILLVPFALLPLAAAAPSPVRAGRQPVSERRRAAARRKEGGRRIAAKAPATSTKRKSRKKKSSKATKRTGVRTKPSGRRTSKRASP
jgi:hypothetical protein